MRACIKWKAVKSEIMNSDLMIVEAMRNGLVLRVISVVVVTSVSPIVGIECGDADGAEQLLPRDHEGAQTDVACAKRVAEVDCDCDCAQP